MTERKKWPHHADGYRLDCIALQKEAQLIMIRQQDAIRRGDREESARLLLELWKISVKVEQLLKEAAR